MLNARLVIGSKPLNLCMKNSCFQFTFQCSNQRGLFISSRNLCVKTDNTNNLEILKRPTVESVTETMFTEFYRFNAIRFGFVLHKLKWFHTVAAVVAVPSSALLSVTGLASYDLLWSVSIPAVVLGCNLYGAAEIFDRAVGFAYLSENGEEVKFAYLDFWGRRVDEIRPITDVVPLLDARRSFLDTAGVLRTLSFYSTEKNLKLYLWVGQITDMERFTKVFGPLEEP